MVGTTGRTQDPLNRYREGRTGGPTPPPAPPFEVVGDDVSRPTSPDGVGVSLGVVDAGPSCKVVVSPTLRGVRPVETRGHDEERPHVVGSDDRPTVGPTGLPFTEGGSDGRSGGGPSVPKRADTCEPLHRHTHVGSHTCAQTGFSYVNFFYL